MGRGIGAKVLVYVSNFRLLECFLLEYFGGAIVLVLVVVVVVVVVTGGKQSQLLV